MNIYFPPSNDPYGYLNNPDSSKMNDKENNLYDLDIEINTRNLETKGDGWITVTCDCVHVTMHTECSECCVS